MTVKILNFRALYLLFFSYITINNINDTIQ